MTSQTPTSTTLARRTVLAAGGAGSAAIAAGASTLPAAQAARARHDVFAHGVASGDPLPRRVLIWTRVTPTRAATPGSGKGPRVGVRWEVATDRRFRDVVRRGRFVTSSARDHTVKLDVTGLQPETTYYYRFIARGQHSPVGTTRTAPAKRATPAHLRFGVVSCSNLQAGWFSAYRLLAERDDLHAVLHLGDYLYEYAPGRYGMGQDNVDVRSHDPANEIVSLEDYRRRHAQYKTDPDLQALHAKYAWIVTWDDHEVTNDQWKKNAENHDDSEGDYLKRRARAHRAYDEWMPVRMDGTASLGDGARLYRRLRFGDLAEISMLDLRTYRSQQVETPLVDSEINDPSRSITGNRQMEWLKDSLTRGNHAPQWKVIGNPVMIAPVTFADLPNELVDPVNDVTGLLPQDGSPYNVDQWDGYTADRREVFAHLDDHQVKDVVFVTGDIHSGWACDLPLDTSAYPALGDSVGVEFVCSSVTSNNLKDITGQPALTPVVEATFMANNRHVKYLNFDDHGFSVLDITAERTQMDWFVIGARDDKQTTATHDASFQTLAGTNVVQRVASPVGDR